MYVIIAQYVCFNLNLAGKKSHLIERLDKVLTQNNEYRKYSLEKCPKFVHVCQYQEGISLSDSFEITFLCLRF